MNVVCTEEVSLSADTAVETIVTIGLPPVSETAVVTISSPEISVVSIIFSVDSDISSSDIIFD